MGSIRAAGSAAQFLLDVLFPPRCVSCHASGALLCTRCLASIRQPEPPLCPRCGRSLANGSQASRSGVCPFCASDQQLRALDGVRAASVYGGVVRQALLALKFRGQRRVAQPLADLLAACYRREGMRADLILPVPLHAGRRHERGFDQATLLARALGSQLSIPVRTDLLVRTRATRPQTTLSRSERHANVAGAFVLTPVAARMALVGKRALLVDDVTTTGSTMDAAASALCDAKPAAIWGLAVARPELETQDDVERSSEAMHVAKGRARADSSDSGDISRSGGPPR